MSASIEFEHSVGHNSAFDSLCYHPNGEDFIYLTGWNIGIGNLNNPHSQQFLRKHDDTTTCLALSRSGTMIASGQKGDNANIYVWHYETKRAIYSFEEHDSMIQHLAFSHDEKLLVSIGDDNDGKLIIWDMSNGCIVAACPKLAHGTTCVTFGGFVKDIKRRDTDRYQLCTGGHDGVVLWMLDPYNGDLTNMKLVGDARATINRHITALSFSDDYAYLYGATSSGDFVIASMKAQKILQSVSASKLGLGSIYGCNNQIITAGGDGYIKLFDSELQLVNETQLDGPVISLSMSPDRLELMAATANGSMYRVNVATMNSLTIAESHTAGITGIAISSKIPDRFATASSDGTIKVWDLAEYVVTATGRPRSHKARGAVAQCICFSDMVISGWNDGSVISHDVDTGDILWLIESAHTDGVTSIAISHNNRFILTGGQHGEVRLWELRSRELISHLKEHTQRITSIYIFDDDTAALTSSRDRCIMQWDLRMERRVVCHTQRMGGINNVTLSKDQNQIVSIGQEKKITFWDHSSPNPVHQQHIDGELEEGLCIARSNDGEFVAAGCASGSLVLYNFFSCQQLGCVLAHSGAVTGVTFSADDRQVLSCGEDGCIVTWNVFR